MFKYFFHSLLFDLFILATIRPPDLCSALVKTSFQNISNYNPLIELKLFKNQNSLNSLSDKKKDFYKAEKSQQKKDLGIAESKAKEYLTISEIPDTAHSAYSSVVQRTGGQVMVNPFLVKKIGLSTLVAGTLFYSVTILPLILMLTGSGPFHEYGPLIRRKRSTKEKRYSNYARHGTEHFELPMLSKFESNKFIRLFENSLELKRIQYPGKFLKIFKRLISRLIKMINFFLKHAKNCTSARSIIKF